MTSVRTPAGRVPLRVIVRLLPFVPPRAATVPTMTPATVTV
jgi:hypothetical protein